MGLLEINSENEFYSMIRSPKLTVVDFYSNNCQPCKVMAPFFAHLSSKFSSVQFMKVNIDRLQQLAQSKRITCTV
ncbi:hypothetical protein HMI55_002651 [Coelomomyces lativittatus]|nr:hypothetical protein HMI55_002651 [Coelomomyces lativittatus]